MPCPVLQYCASCIWRSSRFFERHQMITKLWHIVDVRRTCGFRSIWNAGLCEMLRRRLQYTALSVDNLKLWHSQLFQHLPGYMNGTIFCAMCALYRLNAAWLYTCVPPCNECDYHVDVSEPFRILWNGIKLIWTYNIHISYMNMGGDCLMNCGLFPWDASAHTPLAHLAIPSLFTSQRENLYYIYYLCTICLAFNCIL